MLLRPQGTWTGTSGIVGIMSRPTVPLFDDKMESLDEVDDELLDTLLDCELGACVVVVQEEEEDERD